MGRWNTLLSLLPMKVSEFEELPDDELPPEEEPDPEPPLTLLPLGVVKVEPLVENTTFPLISVL